MSAPRPFRRYLMAAPFGAALLATLALLPPSASAARHVRRHAPALKMIWGPVDLPNGQSAFPTYHRLGVQVFEMDLTWSDVAPTRPANPRNPADPAYRWPSDLALAVQQAAQYGIRICLLVKGTPPWANGGRSTAWAPDNPWDYGNFLIAAAREYPSVHEWMVWGEPNRDDVSDFRPMPVNSPVGPRRYALLLNAGYQSLKSVSKSNIVIGGNTWSFGLVEPADFIKWMRLPNGKPPPLDYYGHNPFGRRFPRFAKPYFPGGRDIDDIGTLESQLARTYHRKVPLWLSEFTISSDHPNIAFNFAVSRRAQANWLTAAFRMVDSVNYVAGLGWFELLDAPPSSNSLTMGLLTWNLQPKPAFYAYQRAR